MKIILSGYYGFDNAGDEALLSAITSSIHKLAPEAKFVVFSGCPEKTASLHNIEAVYYMNPFKLIKELWQADLLISGGGSIFQDITSARSLPYYISVVGLAKLMRKAVIFYAQGVGPINRTLSKVLMRLIANRVDYITLRDNDSKHFLHELGVNKPPMVVTADPVFALEPDERDIIEMQTLLDELGCVKDKTIIGVSVRKWKPLEGYQRKLALLLDELCEDGYQIVFTPMAFPDDVAESEKVAGFMKHKPFVIKRNLSSKEHLALIALFHTMIAMRLHALIFAASRAVPFAGISYDPKIDAFLKLFDLKPLAADYSEMKQEVYQVIENRDVQEDIRSKSVNMRKMSEENARLAIKLIVNKEIVNNY